MGRGVQAGNQLEGWLNTRSSYRPGQQQQEQQEQRVQQQMRRVQAYQMEQHACQRSRNSGDAAIEPCCSQAIPETRPAVGYVHKQLRMPIFGASCSMDAHAYASLAWGSSC
eukprot:627463-Pelagomonas_calceolata.AAC.2